MRCDVHEIFLLSKPLRPALGHTHLPIQRLPGSFPGVNLPVREVNHTPSPNAEVKNEWNYTSTLSVYPHGVVRENVINFICVHNLSFAVTVCKNHFATTDACLGLTGSYGTASSSQTEEKLCMQ